MKHRLAQTGTLTAFCCLLMAGVAGADMSQTHSLDEVNKQLSNPISSIWALQLQQNTYWLNEPDRNVVNLQFQPVLPLALTSDWNLITRPVFQVMNSTPYLNETGHLHSNGIRRHNSSNYVVPQSEAGRTLAAGHRA